MYFRKAILAIFPLILLSCGDVPTHDNLVNFASVKPIFQTEPDIPYQYVSARLYAYHEKIWSENDTVAVNSGMIGLLYTESRNYVYGGDFFVNDQQIDTLNANIITGVKTNFGNFLRTGTGYWEKTDIGFATTDTFRFSTRGSEFFEPLAFSVPSPGGEIEIETPLNSDTVSKSDNLTIDWKSTEDPALSYRIRLFDGKTDFYFYIKGATKMQISRQTLSFFKSGRFYIEVIGGRYAMSQLSETSRYGIAGAYSMERISTILR